MKHPERRRSGLVGAESIFTDLSPTKFSENHCSETKTKEGKANGHIAAIIPHAAAIAASVRNQRVTILSAETVNGRSTLSPRGFNGNEQRPRIVVSQPRRIAAIQLAKRVKEQLGLANSGWKSGRHRIMNDVNDNHAHVVYATVGYLVNWLAHSPTASKMLLISSLMKPMNAQSIRTCWLCC
ncbi:hypothetical protein BCR33DRAFT_790912 [Rhizoclosmatium globosum]|uniref:Uncharacterized protein n=1 Tax=Rhizoclosmatium globosum TaxID=329046 RepID=A0A1Y2BIE1_9FUNG|nr:hypothetical protein BCR33DRAFT_790912 [Rhizoclosmatium globosum]|eukprot:ORY34536.1 hypothetical protein BCR33DRAFT_790912 [Rhizoclosmatium globosum]